MAQPGADLFDVPACRESVGRDASYSQAIEQPIASAIAVALGATVLDPLIGLGITLVILRITWQSWQTISAPHDHDHHQPG